MNYLDLLRLAAPETILVLTSFAVLAADLLALRGLETRSRLVIGALISCAGCALAMGWLLALPQEGNLMNGLLVATPLTNWVKIALLSLTLLTVLISIGTDFTSHVGEYFALVLLAAVGMMLLVSAEDILMIFISLEFTSLSLYILTAFNKRNVKSAEAALKYFLFGGMAAAFTLFGLSLLYGLSGATNLGEIARGIGSAGSGGVNPLFAAALVMAIIGFGFKVAAVPFHLWAPDAYEGAPLPSAALIASGSKLAGFFIFAKVMMLGFAGAEGSAAWRHYLPGWMPVVAILAVLSVVLGNLAAIVQTSVRRLLAYSAIAHAGYLLLGILPHSSASLNSVVYYAVTYGLTTLGAFGVVGLVQQRAGNDRLADFAGLGRREPVLAFCMLIFLLSLAGIPPLAGFFGKFFIFAAVVGAEPDHLGLLWLVILAVAMSAVSLYYYLKVLKEIYIAEAPAGNSGGSAPILSRVVLALVALAVVVLGCAPNLLLGRLPSAVKLVAQP